MIIDILIHSPNNFYYSVSEHVFVCWETTDDRLGVLEPQPPLRRHKPCN